MYKYGHFGVALLTYAPLGFSLLIVGQRTLALVALPVMVFFATLPDYDQRIPLIKHRGVTHTLWFALAVGGVLGALGSAAFWEQGTVIALTAGLFGFVFGTASIVSHLLADVITPAGIRPFWPLSKRKYTLGIVRAANPIANYLLLFLGVVAVAGVWVLVGGLA